MERPIFLESTLKTLLFYKLIVHLFGFPAIRGPEILTIEITLFFKFKFKSLHTEFSLWDPAPLFCWQWN
jgi:hypothetical protein